jgi:biotin transporter BioY
MGNFYFWRIGMGFGELFLLAIGVSMDAFAVSICKGLAVKKARLREMGTCGLWFGGFQALMPLIGYFLGGLFYDAISAFDHWIAFGLLALIGGWIIRRFPGRYLIQFLGLLLGIAVCYAFGTAWFMVETQTPLWSALTLCVFPFVPVDLCKMAVALPVGRSTRSALEKAQLLPEQG